MLFPHSMHPAARGRRSPRVCGNHITTNESEIVMGLPVSRKLIASHLVEGRLNPGEEIGLRIAQTLTQDATGTTVMLELEAMGLKRVRTELSAQYVDHNLLQTDWKNADD